MGRISTVDSAPFFSLSRNHPGDPRWLFTIAVPMQRFAHPIPHDFLMDNFAIFKNVVKK